MLAGADGRVSREDMLVHRGLAMRDGSGAAERVRDNSLLVENVKAVSNPLKIRTMNWPMIFSSRKVVQHFGYRDLRSSQS